MFAAAQRVPLHLPMAWVHAQAAERRGQDGAHTPAPRQLR